MLTTPSCLRNQPPKPQQQLAKQQRSLTSHRYMPGIYSVEDRPGRRKWAGGAGLSGDGLCVVWRARCGIQKEHSRGNRSSKGARGLQGNWFVAHGCRHMDLPNPTQSNPNPTPKPWRRPTTTPAAAGFRGEWLETKARVSISTILFL